MAVFARHFINFEWSVNRLWKVCFETIPRLENSPRIFEIIEEVQTSKDYFITPRPGMCLGQLMITLEGEGELRVGRRRHRLTPGRALLHDVSDPEVGYGYPLDAVKPWRFIWISFPTGAAITAMREIIRTYGRLFDVALDGKAVKMLKSYEKADPVQQLSPLASAGIFYDVMQAVAESAATPLFDHPNVALVRRAQELIRNRVGRRSNFGDIAAELGISREHLSRVFRKQTAQTPYEYALECKMQIAENLLRRGRMSRKEIAFELGFASASGFYAAYRKYAGRWSTAATSGRDALP